MKIEDVKIKDAFYFPTPGNQYKELPAFVPGFEEFGKSWVWNGLIVMASVGSYDGEQWLHISFSRKSKLPTYTEMQMVKRDFIGNRKALFILPKEEHYVNIHKNCLHLWVCEKDKLPDFDAGLGTI